MIIIMIVMIMLLPFSSGGAPSPRSFNTGGGPTVLEQTVPDTEPQYTYTYIYVYMYNVLTYIMMRSIIINT